MSIKVTTIKEVKDTVEEVLRLLGVQGKSFVSAEEGRVNVSVESDDSALLIGREGENLFALRYVLALLSRSALPEGTSLTLDVGDYLKGKGKRIEKIVEEAVKRVAKSGNPETLPPMNSYERMLAHQKISSVEGVTSSSEGEGRDRKVVISRD